MSAGGQFLLSLDNAAAEGDDCSSFTVNTPAFGLGLEVPSGGEFLQ